ncbi:MAG: addiction module protein [Gammaproteobacteria bacterium]|nr:addiction module protein [Gammaproteobacteria bacterium]
MATTAENILKQALNLPATERASVAEELLSSLDKPDPEIDQLWAEEAEARIHAAKLGKMATVSAEDVFGKYEQP